MKLWSKITIGAGVIVLSLATLAWAGNATRRANLGGGGLFRQFIAGRLETLQDLKADLNITDAQRKAIRQVVAAHREELAATIKPVIASRRTLREAVAAGDETAIRNAATNLGKSLGDAAVLASQIRAEIAKILTPDQLEKLKKFRAENDTAVDTLVDDLGKAAGTEL